MKSSLSERKVDGTDYPLIRERLVAAKAKTEQVKTWAKYGNVDECMHHIHLHDNAYIVQGYLVIFSVSQPWFTDKLFLLEELVLRLYGNSDISAVTRFLERQAKDRGCVLVGTGTLFSSSDRALSALYQRQGFKPEATTLIKEL